MKNALPLILAGGAALIFMGGKNKSKKTSTIALPKQCMEIKSKKALYSRFEAEANNPSGLPQAIVIYPKDEVSRAHDLCRAAASSGFAKVFLVSSSIMADMAMDELESWRDEAAASGADVSEFPMPSRSDIEKSLVGVITMKTAEEDEEVETSWGEIPWSDLKSLFA